MSTLQVVKVGGAALSDAGWLERFARAANDDTPRVVVHGGGPEVSELSQRLDVQVAWHEGRRVTSPEALDVVAMVLSGKVNKRIVRALCAVGVDAIGLSGEDAHLIDARVSQGGRLGRVGDVIGVRVDVLRRLRTAGFTPVVSPVSTCADGGALNVNADEVATAVAIALQADELIYLTDVNAVRNGAVQCDSITVDEADSYIRGGIATGGMAVKLSAAAQAVRAGVETVRVGSLEMLRDQTAGTTIRMEVAA